MLKRLIMCMAVVFTLMFGAVCFAEEQAVPVEAIQLLIDDSIDIQSTYGAGMAYKEWKELYGKLVRDEAKFSAKYPGNKFSQIIGGLMQGYGLANEGWYYYMKGTDDTKSKGVIQSGMDYSKTWQGIFVNHKGD